MRLSFGWGSRIYCLDSHVVGGKAALDGLPVIEIAVTQSLHLAWSLDVTRRSRTDYAGPEGLDEIEALVAHVIARHPTDPFAYTLPSKAFEA